jgi:3-deoxy-manno-octulosonate cytidylyltransferase (CMP-KDO synthetase)
MKIACLIPARYNSTRFPGKLLKLVRGKTVLQRTIESALGHFEVFVATDDERIAEHAREVGAVPIWTASTHVNGSERIAEAIGKVPEAELILNLQGDHPCMNVSTMQAAIALCEKDPTLMMSTVATPIRSEADFRAPHIVKAVLDPEGYALYFSRSPIPYSKSGVPKMALQHIGLYCFRREFLLQYAQVATTPLQGQEDLEMLKVLEKGYRIRVAVVEETCIGVDIPSDLEKLEEYTGSDSKIGRWQGSRPDFLDPRSDHC